MDRQAVRTALALVVIAAAGIEYAQSWFVGRYPDVTDVAFSAFGGVLGAGSAAEAPSSSRALGRRPCVPS